MLSTSAYCICITISIITFTLKVNIISNHLIINSPVLEKKVNIHICQNKSDILICKWVRLDNI